MSENKREEIKRYSDFIKELNYNGEKDINDVDFISYLLYSRSGSIKKTKIKVTKKDDKRIELFLEEKEIEELYTDDYSLIVNYTFNENNKGEERKRTINLLKRNVYISKR